MGCSVPGVIDIPKNSSHSIQIHCRHQYLLHLQRTGGSINLHCPRIHLTNRVDGQTQSWGSRSRTWLPTSVLMTLNPMQSRFVRRIRQHLHLLRNCVFGCGCGCGCGGSDGANKGREGGRRGTVDFRRVINWHWKIINRRGRTTSLTVAINISSIYKELVAALICTVPVSTLPIGLMAKPSLGEVGVGPDCRRQFWWLWTRCSPGLWDG